MVEPLAARATARATVRTGVPGAPVAASDPPGETNSAPAGTGYAVEPTAGDPAVRRVPVRSMAGCGSVTVAAAASRGVEGAACPGAEANNGAATMRVRAAAPATGRFRRSRGGTLNLRVAILS